MTTAILAPRAFQQQAVDRLYESWDSGLRRLAVVHATGLGKTVTMVHTIARYLDSRSDKRVVVLVHTDELVQQTERQLQMWAPHLDVGIVKAVRNEVTQRVVIASVQSLRSVARRDTLRNVGMVVIDEVHHSTATTYRKILEHYGCMVEYCSDCIEAHAQVFNDQNLEIWPNRCPDHGCAVNAPLVAGFTATLARSDSAKLSDVIQAVADRRDISWGVRHGFLVPPRGKRVEIDDLHLENVRRSGGDFQRGSLGEALERSLAPETVAKAYREHGEDPVRPGQLRSGILFAPTISSAQMFSDAFNDAGIRAEMLSYETDRSVRRAVVQRVMDGTTTVVCNPTLLTEGFDAPRVSAVIVARPTRSKPLYQQMVGRGLRPDPTVPYGDQDCLIFDAVGASYTHGLASLIDLSERKHLEYRDDVTLVDLEDERERFEAEPEPMHHGPVMVIDFDPLASASKRVWQRTAAGVYFTPAGTGPGACYVFIAPGEPGTHDVYWCTQKAKDLVNGKRGARTEHCGLSLEAAFAWGEDLADELTPFGSINKRKNASWRNNPPTDKIRSFARQLGITVPVDARKMGPIADLIDTIQATNRIDPIVAFFLKGDPT